MRQISPKRDERSVGIGFVDVLFALVVAKVLDSVSWSDLHHVSGVRVANLSIATVATLASWIGYHNSINRPRFKIRFFNWPLAQFALDILMVFDYWLLATSAGVARQPSARDGVTAGLVLFAFVLYCLWDLVSFFIGRQEKYQDLIEDPDEKWKGYKFSRNATTWLCTLLSFAAWLVATHAPESHLLTFIIDGWLAVVLIGFRLLKDSKAGPRTDHASGTHG